MSLKSVLIAIVLGTGLAGGLFVATRLSQPAALASAFEIPVATALPEFELQDQFGQPVGAAAFEGQWDLLFFGFTHCPDICPTTLQTLSIARGELAAAGAGELPRIVLVSVDPERDDAESLGRYVDHFGDGNLGITGSIAELRKLTGALGIYFEKAPLEDGAYNVDHSAAVIVIDPAGRFSALFSAPLSVEDLVHDLPLLMRRR